MSLPPFEAFLRDFYRIHCPNKLVNVKAAATKYACADQEKCVFG